MLSFFFYEFFTASAPRELRLAPTVPVNHPPPYVGGTSFGGKFPPMVFPKLPIYTGGVETFLIYRVSFNSPYILIILFFHDINPV